MRAINYILLTCFFFIGMAPVPFLHRIRSFPLYQLVLKQTLAASPVGNTFRYGGQVAVSENGQHILVSCHDCTVSSALNSGLVDYWKKGAGESWTRTNSFNPTALADGEFGYVMAMSGDGNYAAVTGQNQTRIYIYKRNNSTNVWDPTHNFVSPNFSPSIPFAYTEMALNYDGTYLVIGAGQEVVSSVNFMGRVYVYYRQSANSTFDSTPIANLPNPKPVAANRYFGWSVGISRDGTWIIVGARSEDNTAVDTGNAYIYQRTGTTTINPTPQELGTEKNSGNLCGANVRINNKRALVGCSASPKMLTYFLSGNTWVLNTSLTEYSKLDLSDTAYSINTGGLLIKHYVENRNVYTTGANVFIPGPNSPDVVGKISIDGRYVVVGDYIFDDAGFTDSGRAYVYKLE
jgi:hypothetical protein